MAEGIGVTLKHPVGPEQNLNKNSGDKALGNSWNLAMLGLNKVFKDGSTIFPHNHKFNVPFYSSPIYLTNGVN